MGEAASPLFLDAELAPHRSLPPRGFNILMAVVGGVSFVYGIFFLAIGAWPVFGFLGLDVFLIWLAFRLNYRSGRRRERIRLGLDTLLVERIGIHGDRREWRFQPYWLRVVFEEKDEETNRLLVTSHGRWLALGTFLGAPQRRELAARLEDALGRWRRHFSG